MSNNINGNNIPKLQLNKKAQAQTLKGGFRSESLSMKTVDNKNKHNDVEKHNAKQNSIFGMIDGKGENGKADGIITDAELKAFADLVDANKDGIIESGELDKYLKSLDKETVETYYETEKDKLSGKNKKELTAREAHYIDKDGKLKEVKIESKDVMAVLAEIQAAGENYESTSVNEDGNIVLVHKETGDIEVINPETREYSITSTKDGIKTTTNYTKDGIKKDEVIVDENNNTETTRTFVDGEVLEKEVVVDRTNNIEITSNYEQGMLAEKISVDSNSGITTTIEYDKTSAQNPVKKIVYSAKFDPDSSEGATVEEYTYIDGKEVQTVRIVNVQDPANGARCVYDVDSDNYSETTIDGTTKYDYTNSPNVMPNSYFEGTNGNIGSTVYDENGVCTATTINGSTKSVEIINPDNSKIFSREVIAGDKTYKLSEVKYNSNGEKTSEVSFDIDGNKISEITYKGNLITTVTYSDGKKVTEEVYNKKTKVYTETSYNNGNKATVTKYKLVTKKGETKRQFISQTAYKNGKKRTVNYDKDGNIQLTLQRGENLGFLAEALGLSVREVLDLNGYKYTYKNGIVSYYPNQKSAGSTIILPTNIDVNSPFFDNRKSAEAIRKEIAEEKRAQNIAKFNEYYSLIDNNYQPTTIGKFLVATEDMNRGQPFKDYEVKNANDIARMMMCADYHMVRYNYFPWDWQRNMKIAPDKDEIYINACTQWIINNNPDIFDKNGNFKKTECNNGIALGKIGGIKVPFGAGSAIVIDRHYEREFHYQQNQFTNQGVKLANQVFKAKDGMFTDESSIANAINNVNKENVVAFCNSYYGADNNKFLIKDLHGDLCGSTDSKSDKELYNKALFKIKNSLLARARELGFPTNNEHYTNLQNAQTVAQYDQAISSLAAMLGIVENTPPDRRNQNMWNRVLGQQDYNKVANQAAQRQDKATKEAQEFEKTPGFWVSASEFLSKNPTAYHLFWNAMNGTIMPTDRKDMAARQEMRQGLINHMIGASVKNGSVTGANINPENWNDVATIIFGRVPTDAELKVISYQAEQLENRIAYEQTCQEFTNWENWDSEKLRNKLLGMGFDEKTQKRLKNATPEQLNTFTSNYICKLEQAAGQQSSQELAKNLTQGMKALYAPGMDPKIDVAKFIREKKQKGAYLRMGVTIVGNILVGVATGGSSLAVQAGCTYLFNAAIGATDIYNIYEKCKDLPEPDRTAMLQDATLNCLKNASVDTVLMVSGMRYGKYFDDMVAIGEMSAGKAFAKTAAWDVGFDVAGTYVRDGEITINGVAYSFVFSAAGNFVGYLPNKSAAKAAKQSELTDAEMKEILVPPRVQEDVKNGADINTRSGDVNGRPTSRFEEPLSDAAYLKAHTAMTEEVNVGMTQARKDQLGSVLQEMRDSGNPDLIAQANTLQAVLDQAKPIDLTGYALSGNLTEMYKNDPKTMEFIKGLDPETQVKVSKEFDGMKITGYDPATGKPIVDMESHFRKYLEEKYGYNDRAASTPDANSQTFNAKSPNAVGPKVTDGNPKTPDGSPVDGSSRGVDPETPVKSQTPEVKVSNEGLNQLVTDGKITQAQADELAALCVDDHTAKVVADLTREYGYKPMEQLVALQKANPAKYQEMVNAGLFKLIDEHKVDPRIINGVNETTFLSNRTLSDMKKLSNGEDLITRPKSQEEFDSFMTNKANDGEVCEFNGKLYVNDNGTKVELNLTPEKFNELFPPLGRASFIQGADLGDCWLLSNIDNMMDLPGGRVAAYQMFSMDGNDVYVQIPGTKQKVKFTDSEVLNAGGSQIESVTAQQPKGLMMLEQAYAVHKSASHTNSDIPIDIMATYGANPKKLMEKLDRSEETFIAMNKMLGRSDAVSVSSWENYFLWSTKSKNKIEQQKQIISEYANDSNHMLGFSTDPKVENPKYNIVGGHAYTIKAYNPETGMVYITNPHNSATLTEIPLEELTKYINKTYHVEIRPTADAPTTTPKTELDNTDHVGSSNSADGGVPPKAPDGAGSSGVEVPRGLDVETPVKPQTPEIKAENAQIIDLSKYEAGASVDRVSVEQGLGALQLNGKPRFTNEEIQYMANFVKTKEDCEFLNKLINQCTDEASNQQLVAMYSKLNILSASDSSVHANNFQTALSNYMKNNPDAKIDIKDYNKILDKCINFEKLHLLDGFATTSFYKCIEEGYSPGAINTILTNPQMVSSPTYMNILKSGKYDSVINHLDNDFIYIYEMNQKLLSKGGQYAELANQFDEYMVKALRNETKSTEDLKPLANLIWQYQESLINSGTKGLNSQLMFQMLDNGAPVSIVKYLLEHGVEQGTAQWTVAISPKYSKYLKHIENDNQARALLDMQQNGHLERFDDSELEIILKNIDDESDVKRLNDLLQIEHFKNNNYKLLQEFEAGTEIDLKSANTPIERTIDPAFQEQVKQDLKYYNITGDDYNKLLQLSQTNPKRYQDIVNSGLLKLINEGKVPRTILKNIDDNTFLSNRTLSDIKKIANGEDLITRPKTSAEAEQFFSVKDADGNFKNDGEVCEINGKLYVNDNGNRVELNITPEKFNELFPPLTRVSFEQGGLGDCWLVSAIDNLMDKPAGRVAIYKMFSQQGDDIYVEFPGAAQPIKFADSQVLNAGSKHIKTITNDYPMGAMMLEQAYAVHRNGLYTSTDAPTDVIASFADPGKLMLENKGGWSSEFYKTVFGKGSTVVTTNKINDINTLKNVANDPNCVINFGTISRGERTEILINADYDLYSGHEYAIKAFDEATGMVYITNPWHTSVITEVPVDELLKYVDGFDIVELRPGTSQIINENSSIPVTGQKQSLKSSQESSVSSTGKVGEEVYVAEVYKPENDYVVAEVASDYQPVARQITSENPGLAQHENFVSNRPDLFGTHVSNYVVGFDGNGNPVRKNVRIDNNGNILYTYNGNSFIQSANATKKPHCAWKMHIHSVNNLDYQQLSEVVIPYLQSKGISFKALSPSRTPEGLATNAHQAGKAISIYPASEAEMATIAKDLDKLLRDNNLTQTGTNIFGDAPMGSTGRLFYRYELNSGKHSDKVFNLQRQSDCSEYEMLYRGNDGNYLASDMTVADDPWANFDPSNPNSKPGDSPVEIKPEMSSPVVPPTPKIQPTIDLSNQTVLTNEVNKIKGQRALQGVASLDQQHVDNIIEQLRRNGDQDQIQSLANVGIKHSDGNVKIQEEVYVAEVYKPENDYVVAEVADDVGVHSYDDGDLYVPEVIEMDGIHNIDRTSQNPPTPQTSRIIDQDGVIIDRSVDADGVETVQVSIEKDGIYEVITLSPKGKAVFDRLENADAIQLKQLESFADVIPNPDEKAFLLDRIKKKKAEFGENVVISYDNPAFTSNDDLLYMPYDMDEDYGL